MVTIDANFYTSSAEAQIHIIGHVENREKAKVIIMTRLSIWLNSQRSDSNKDNNNTNTTTANSTNNNDNILINNSNTCLLAHPNGTLEYDLKLPNLPLSHPLSPTTGTSDNNSNSNSSDSHDQHHQQGRDREQEYVSGQGEAGQGHEGAETRKPYIPKQFSTQFADQFSVLPPHLQINKSGTLTVDEYMARLRYDIDHNHTNHTFSTDTGTQHITGGGAGGGGGGGQGGGNEVEEGGGEVVGISRTSSG